MIPKIIHYCWFGQQPKSAIALQCLESWKTHCPDFEWKEWNEINTKKYHNNFYKDAYRNKKYAFVADCVRVQALYEYGGVYLDLDMLLLQPIDKLLNYDFFSGYEVPDRVAYGFFGGVPKHRFFEKMKAFYGQNRFNRYSVPVITHTFSELINDATINNNEALLTPVYMYALRYQDKADDYKKHTTAASIAVHLWDHSWGEARPEETIITLVKKFITVQKDTLVHGYPSAYWKRYSREFARKIYHKVVGKK